MAGEMVRLANYYQTASLRKTNGNFSSKRTLLYSLLLTFYLTIIASGMILPKLLSSSKENAIQPAPDLFDQVVDDVVIQLKIPDTSFSIHGNPARDTLRYRVFAYPSRTPLELLDTVRGYPVRISLLHENDFLYREQPEKGTSTSEPYVMVMTRVPDHRQVTFLIIVDDAAGNFVGNTIFSFSQIQKTQGMVTMSVKSSRGREVGTFLLDYLIVKPIAVPEYPQLLSGEGAALFKDKSHHRVVHLGHRGLGVGVRYDIPGYEELQENTVSSYNYAGSHGANMIELDVSLTKDLQIVVYHDLVLNDMETGQTVGIRDLTYDELLTHRYQPLARHGPSSIKSKNVADQDTALFPLLSTVLQRVNPDIAINIEVKYPHPIKHQPGQWFPYQPFDINIYLDIILAQVADFARSREIMFSSFEPDICVGLKLKQTRYPSFLLTRNGLENPPCHDEKRNNIELGINFAGATLLVGVNSYGEYLLKKGASFVSFMHKKLDLVVYTWEGPLTPEQLNTLVDMDVDGLCYDKIDLKRDKVKDSSRHSRRRPSVIVRKPIQDISSHNNVRMPIKDTAIASR